MKHVSHYGRLDRDSQKSVGGWCQPAGDSPADGDAPADLEEDSGTQRATPGYRQQQPRPRKKLGAFLERIRQILKKDQAMPRKQRHTAKRIWERLREDGFTGGYTVVKDAVRELTQKNQEVFVPLQHLPGEAQVDFGHALAKVNGQ